MTWQAFFCNAVVVVTLRVCMRWCTDGGHCGQYEKGAFFMFDISQGQGSVYLAELVPMAVLGVAGGIIGASFTAGSELLCFWRRDFVAPLGPSVRVLEALIVSVFTSAVSFVTPLAFGCTPCPKHLSDCPRSVAHPAGNFVGFGCERPGHYNDLATLLFNTPETAIRNLFSSNTQNEYTAGSLLTFVVLFYSLSLMTYGISLPSGLFVPGILCGAAYGRLMGMFMVKTFPGMQDIDEGTYAVLGAASFLAGATRMTVSICVVLLELTNNLALLPLIMLVLLVSKARLFSIHLSVHCLLAVADRRE